MVSLDELPRSVLVVATHPDDEVIGCGGLLALHAGRGDRVRVLIVSDGGEGERRVAESRAAGRELGVEDLVFLGLPDGQVGHEPRLVAKLERSLSDFEPELVYGPSLQEWHADHVAVSQALLSALAQRAQRAQEGQTAACPRLRLYGTNRQPLANVLHDTTSVAERKDAALACFASQLERQDLVDKTRAFDRSWTMNVDQPEVMRAEGFAEWPPDELPRFLEAHFAAPGARPDESHAEGTPELRAGSATAVISSWNKIEDVRANLSALRAQTQAFDRVVVVDNASSDGSIEMIRNEFPEVHLVVMPHSRYGACETFNIGFANSHTEFTAILDDDVVLPPDWLEKSRTRLQQEPPTTAILSTKVVEPGMPDSYRDSATVNRERYMSTFRGCASLARTQPLMEAGGYDERLFIYGNERDLTCRLLNMGCRVLQYPGAQVFHQTPFGMKMGKRSLYYHARNAWLSMLKYAPMGDLLRMPFLVFGKVVLRSGKREAAGEVTDAVGTIGLSRALRETPGAWGVLFKAGCSVLWNVPYCLRRREPVRAADFELPIQ